MNVEVRAVGLRAMRDRHKLTQRELARRLGVTQNYIPALEAGTRNPGLVKSLAATAPLSAMTTAASARANRASLMRRRRLFSSCSA